MSLLWCQSFAAEAYRAIFSDAQTLQACIGTPRSKRVSVEGNLVQAILFKHLCAEEKVHLSFQGKTYQK